MNDSMNIVFFGGAGTSTESGIPDFRSADGLFSMNEGHAYSPEEILSRDFFKSHVHPFFQFYKERMIYPHAKPNETHHILAKLEEKGRLRAVITQNIDGLHQQAGSRNVIELHGTVHRNKCMNCRKDYSLEQIMRTDNIVPYCELCNGIVKPEVVLYQESLDENVLDKAIQSIREAEVLIVAGTSLSVHPAAGLIRYYQGDKLILINKSITPYDNLANFVFRDAISNVFSTLF